MTPGEAYEIIAGMLGTTREVPGAAADALAHWVNGFGEQAPPGVVWHEPPVTRAQELDNAAIMTVGSLFVMIADGEFAAYGYPAVRDREHEHRWLPDALCVPPQVGHAVVLFRCQGCPLTAYGHAVPEEVRDAPTAQTPALPADHHPA